MGVPDTGLVELDQALQSASDGVDPAPLEMILQGLPRALVSDDATCRVRFANHALATLLALEPGRAGTAATLHAQLETSGRSRSGRHRGDP